MSCHSCACRAGSECGDLEAHAKRGELRVCDQPGLRATAQALALALVHRLERVAEPRPALLLHLDEQQPLPAAHDEVELDAAGSDVPSEHLVATEAVVPSDASLRSPAAVGGA